MTSDPCTLCTAVFGLKPALWFPAIVAVLAIVLSVGAALANRRY